MSQLKQLYLIRMPPWCLPVEAYQALPAGWRPWYSLGKLYSISQSRDPCSQEACVNRVCVCVCASPVATDGLSRLEEVVVGLVEVAKLPHLSHLQTLM